MLTFPLLGRTWTTQFSDSFDRSDRFLSGDNGWITDWIPWAISTNRARWGSTDPQSAYAHVFRGTDRTVAFAECVPKHQLIGPIVRANADPLFCNAGYTAVRDGSLFVLYRIDGALLRTVVATSGTIPNLTSDKVRIEAELDVISLSINGSLVISAKDGKYASGRSGLWVDAVAGGSIREADDFVEAI